MITFLNQWFSYHSVKYIFSLSIQIQFTAIFEKSDSQELLLLEIKKHPKHTDPIHCHLWKKWFTGIFIAWNKETWQIFFGHSNIFIYKNFKLCSDQVLNFFIFLKPNVFIWFVFQLSVWNLNHWNGMFYITLYKVSV